MLWYKKAEHNCSKSCIMELSNKPFQEELLCSTLIIHENYSICKMFWLQRLFLPNILPLLILKCPCHRTFAPPVTNLHHTYTTTANSLSAIYPLSAQTLSSITAGADTDALIAVNASPSGIRLSPNTIA